MCLSVCHEKWSLPTSERWRREVSRLLGRSWPSDDDDDDGVGDYDGADDEGGGDWGSEVEVLK